MHHHDRLPVQLLRDERQRRRLPVDDDRHQLVRRLGDPVAVEAQDVSGDCSIGQKTGPASTFGPSGTQSELELGDDPEVAAAAAEAPEEVGVLVLARLARTRRRR